VKGGRSIRARLILALVGVSVFTLLVVGLMFYLFLGGYLLDRQKDQLLDQAVGVAEQVEGLRDALPATPRGERVRSALLRSDLRALPAGAGIVVFEGTDAVAKVGQTPAKAENLERLRAEGERLGADGPGAGVVRSLVNAAGRRVSFVVAAAPIELSDGTRGQAVVTLAKADAFGARRGLFRMLLLAGVIAVALAIAIGLGLGSWMTRPIRRLSSAAKTMATGSYDEPVTGAYPGEVQELADSLETMRREVRHSEESLRGFVGSAAHELRTPLTSIQGFSQALLDGTAASPEQQQRSAAAIYRESGRLKRLVDALLILSRYDSGEFHPSRVPVVVETLVREEIDRLVATGSAEPGRITVEAGTETQAVADPDMLRQVIANLLRNAVRYGGDDPVTVRIWTQGAELLIEVANGGEPLGAEERARIFDRFYRGREGRRHEGFGLGVALVREICGVLGGRVELVGGGPSTVFRVTLPANAGGAL
jgi:signal transduction histidine kinase